MIFIPAIDLIDGKCVRLHMGNYSKKKVYYDKPIEVAKRFVDDGAKYLHIIDLDSAKNPEKDNLKVIEKIIKSVDVPIEVGGGIRDKEKAKRLFSIGIDRIIIGTLLVKNPKIVEELSNNYPGKIAAAIDAKDGNVYISGWTEGSNIKALDLVLKAKNLGIRIIVYTDIKRDGTLVGPNLEGIKEMSEIVDISLIAAGGIHSIEDLKKIKAIAKENVIGVISGKAIYDGKINVKEAVRVLEGE